ncbi:MAG: hypothetical protein AVDCRST_MAG06-3296, partial [uncultured Nocardioides sp.]
ATSTPRRTTSRCSPSPRPAGVTSPSWPTRAGSPPGRPTAWSPSPTCRRRAWCGSTTCWWGSGSPPWRRAAWSSTAPTTRPWSPRWRPG